MYTVWLRSWNYPRPAETTQFYLGTLRDLYHDIIVNHSPEPQLSDYPPVRRTPLSLLHSVILFSSCKTPRGLWAGSIPKWVKVCPHKWSRERKGPAGPGQEVCSPRLHGPHLERAARSCENRQRRQSWGRTGFPLLFWPLHHGPNMPDLGTFLGRPLCCAGWISCHTYLPATLLAGTRPAWSPEQWHSGWFPQVSRIRNPLRTHEVHGS